MVAVAAFSFLIKKLINLIKSLSAIITSVWGEIRRLRNAFQVCLLISSVANFNQNVYKSVAIYFFSKKVQKLYKVLLSFGNFYSGFVAVLPLFLNRFRTSRIVSGISFPDVSGKNARLPTPAKSADAPSAMNVNPASSSFAPRSTM